MRTGLTFLCLSLCLAINTSAQEQSDTEKFSAFLSNNDAAVVSLKKDLASGVIKIALHKDVEFSIDNWQTMLMHLISGWSGAKTLLLPKDFFELDSCQQKVAVQALALIYDHLNRMGDEQIKMFARLSGGAGDEDITDSEEKELLTILNGFEKLALDNTDKLVAILFIACTTPDRESIFPGFGAAVSDAKEWSKLAKKKIAAQFEEFRLMLKNR